MSFINFKIGLLRDCCFSVVGIYGFVKSVPLPSRHHLEMGSVFSLSHQLKCLQTFIVGIPGPEYPQESFENKKLSSPSTSTLSLKKDFWIVLFLPFFTI